MKYIRRFLEFIASRVAIVTLVVALLVMSFYLAMNIANIYVMVDEGLDARAAVIMSGEGEEELSKYFRDEFLFQDAALQVGLSAVSPYKDYEIRGYRHEIRLLSVWCWPWDTVARAEIEERIPAIDGTIRSSSRAAALAEGGEARLSPPAWTPCRYRVTMVRTGGRWKISNLQLLEQLTQ